MYPGEIYFGIVSMTIKIVRDVLFLYKKNVLHLDTLLGGHLYIFFCYDSCITGLVVAKLFAIRFEIRKL